MVPVYPRNISADVWIVTVVVQHSTELRQDGKRDKERPGVSVVCQVPQHGGQLRPGSGGGQVKRTEQAIVRVIANRKDR